MTSITEAIDVETDPVTAFAVFTDEFDQWWGRGPIDAFDSWRLIERRIEGGVGGRLVEDYGDEKRVVGGWSAEPRTCTRSSTPKRTRRSSGSTTGSRPVVADGAAPRCVLLHRG